MYPLSGWPTNVRATTEAKKRTSPGVAEGQSTYIVRKATQ